MVIIKGFALKTEKSALIAQLEALQVVCGVDDGPKTDRLVAFFLEAAVRLVQVGNIFT